MTRKTLNQVKVDVAALIPDNTTGLVSPADVRAVLIDAIDSLNTAASIAYGAPNTATAMTATPTRLPATYFPNVFNDDSSILEARAGTDGDIIAHSDVGQLMLDMNATFHAANGTDVNFYIARNGVVLPPIARGTGTGAGDFQTITMSWLVIDLTLNDSFTVFAATPGGAASVTIGGCAIKGILLPTMN